MAESMHEAKSNNSPSNRDGIVNLECAVCLQPSVHPAELPCGHIFCYLCIKGIVNQGRRCAMCRQDIPIDYLDKPKLLKPMDPEVPSQGFEDGHLWFYEGHNGWWQYDERTSIELESAYQKGERCCDLLIAGFLYVADFDGMLQYRKNDPSRRRRIKRDLATTSKKGIAGLKSSKHSNTVSSNSSDSVVPERIQPLPSNLPNINSIRIFSSGSSIPGPQTEPVQNSQRISSRCNLPTERLVPNLPTRTDTSLPQSRSFDLDSVIHETLDWTIEQIESLNLELLNDYETLFRDVSNYERLDGNLNTRRPNSFTSRRPNNYMSRYLNVTNPLNQSDLGSSDRLLDLAQNEGNEENSSSDSSPIATEDSPIYSNVTPSQVSPLAPGDTSPPPLPPPRNRGLFRTRLQRDLQNLSNLNCDLLLKKFPKK